MYWYLYYTVSVFFRRYIFYVCRSTLEKRRYEANDTSFLFTELGSFYMNQGLIFTIILYILLLSVYITHIRLKLRHRGQFYLKDPTKSKSLRGIEKKALAMKNNNIC